MYTINKELKFTFVVTGRTPPEGFFPVTESLAFTARDYFTGRYRKNLYTSFFKLTGKKEPVIPGFYGETLFCIEESIFEELFEDVFMEVQLKNIGSPDTYFCVNLYVVCK